MPEDKRIQLTGSPPSEQSGRCSLPTVDVSVAGPFVTVDEMLASFRGRVAFRIYIPFKQKYGLKLFMVNDSRSQYALNAIPYLGKTSVQEQERPQDVNQ